MSFPCVFVDDWDRLDDINVDTDFNICVSVLSMKSGINNWMTGWADGIHAATTIVHPSTVVQIISGTADPWSG